MQRLKLSLIVLTVFFSSISLFAQTDSSKCNSQIQFHLINGYSLSYLNSLSSSSGIRFKADIGLSGASSSSEYAQSFYNSGSGNSNSDVQKNNDDRSSSAQYLNLAVNYFWFSNITNEMKLYFGLGPLISFTRSSYESNQDRIGTSYNAAFKSFSETVSSSIGVGFQGAVGIECAVSKKISLLAEFDLDGTFNWNHWKNIYESQQTGTNGTESTNDGNSWNYGLNRLKIGISYNF